jgi:hypothetical protein
MGDPIEYPNVMNIQRSGGNVHLPQMGVAEPGKFLMGPEGRRMLYGTADDKAIFVAADTTPSGMARVGKVFYQSKSSFAHDVNRYGPLAETGRRLMASQEVIKNFLDVFTGIVATAGGPVAWGIAGMNVAVTAGKVKQEYAAFSKVMETILYHHGFLFQKVPAFTSNALGHFLAGVLEDKAINFGKGFVAKSIPGAGGKVAGVILGQLGEARTSTRMKALSKTLKEVLIKVAVHQSTVYPAQLSEEQVVALARNVRKHLCEMTEYKVTDIILESMVREIGQNPLSLEARFRAIATAIDTVY